MAGIYIHIPYCKLKCHYCDFHFSTNLSTQSEMLDCMIQELSERKLYLNNEIIKTIYFGGGTPSFIGMTKINRLIQEIFALFPVDNKVEITLECNPDDLTKNFISELKNSKVNRLSIGIQSFDDAVLKQMNRAHDSNEVIYAIKQAQDIGITNITADLIYGIPNKDLLYWEKQLATFYELEIPHLSAYCLTIEPGTYYGHQYKKGKLTLIEDEQALQQFDFLIQSSIQNNYEQYEISNFAKNQNYSQHNTGYWLGQTYLGIGPSAHSYNYEERRWNVSNNHQYIQSIKNQKNYFESELLSKSDKCNDYILTRLRTKWGIDLKDIQSLAAIHTTEIIQQINFFEKEGLVQINNDTVTLTLEGKYQADGIASALFIQNA